METCSLLRYTLGPQVPKLLAPGPVCQNTWAHPDGIATERQTDEAQRTPRPSSRFWSDHGLSNRGERWRLRPRWFSHRPSAIVSEE